MPAMDHESEQPYLLARRKSFRCPIADADFDWELRVDQQRYPAAVVDESSGGFGVLVEGPVPLKPDDRAWLRHRSGWSEVRVVHVSPAESLEAESPDGPSPSPARTRLGLKRLRDLEVPDSLPPSPWVALRDLRAPMIWLFGSAVRTVVGGVLFAILVVGIPAIVVATLFPGGRAAVDKLLPESRWNQRLAESAQRAGTQLAPRSSADPATAPGLLALQRAGGWQSAPSSANESLPSAPAAASPSRLAAPAVELIPQSMRETIRRLPGASAFEVPAVARYLDLTPAQQAQIAQIVEQTAAALNELQTQFRGAGRQAIARYEALLFDHARQQAEAVLDQSQRARWHALCGTAPPDQSQPEEPAGP